jgi:Mg/Co/Ni transporter MgtE
MSTARYKGDVVTMGLSAPNLLTFLISFVIVLAVVFAKYFGATIPGLTSDSATFVGLLVAYLVLWLGCLFRWL